MIDGYLDDRGVYTDLDGKVIDLVNRCKPSRVEVISPGMVELVQKEIKSLVPPTIDGLQATPVQGVQMEEFVDIEIDDATRDVLLGLLEQYGH